MNLILLIASAAEIAIATIILWYVVDLLTTMPANMRMVVKYLIVLVAILVVISMFVGQPIHVGFLPSSCAYHKVKPRSHSLPPFNQSTSTPLNSAVSQHHFAAQPSRGTPPNLPKSMT